jgi:hypothetical protein
MKYINFVFFWMLATFALSRADPMGLLLSLVGFLVMHTYIEELFDDYG